MRHLRHTEHIQPLVIVQKKTIRIICKAELRTPTAPLMKKPSLLNLTSLYTLRVCAEMHPFIHQSTKKTTINTGHSMIIHTLRSQMFTRTQRDTQTDTSSHQTRTSTQKLNNPSTLSHILPSYTVPSGTHYHHSLKTQRHSQFLNGN